MKEKKPEPSTDIKN